ncbi:MAG: glycosyltransferase family A protein, partial [Bacteroidales bacterium]
MGFADAYLLKAGLREPIIQTDPHSDLKIMVAIPVTNESGLEKCLDSLFMAAAPIRTEVLILVNAAASATPAVFEQNLSTLSRARESFTDEWHRGGRAVEDWAFGLTTAQRRLKPAFGAVQGQFRQAPYYPLSRVPRVSVVVACHNGQRTLKACLDALGRLGYPDYEVLLVDDGSDDATAQIALGYPAVRTLRQDHHGLSVARNSGIAAATGEIIAFTDAD